MPDMMYDLPRVAHPCDGAVTKEDANHPDMANCAACGVSFYTPAQNPPAGSAVIPQPGDAAIPKLFAPLIIRGVTFHNRIAVSPMCQYSAHEGFHTPWHLTHLGGIVQRGPGLTIVEATAVQSRGRITPEDSGIWLDAHVPGLKASVDFAHSQNQKIGIQLAHAGRKASTVAPWISFGDVATHAVGGWPDDVLGPSAVSFSDGRYPVPRAATLDDIKAVKDDFVAGTRRAIAAGFDVVEVHSAHGYLLHSFLSPASNFRTDQYGGSFENRSRLLLEVVESVRAVMPKDMPLFVRISATDWLEHVEGFGTDDDKSWTLEQSVRLASLLAERGVDLLDVSTGGNHKQQKIEGGPLAYQARFAQEIKKSVGDKLLVSTVGCIREAKVAESLLQGEGGKAPLDVVMAGRPFQKNPGLVWTWADELGLEITQANQIGWGFAGRGKRQNKE